jgi:ferric-dicitrate binding protein FerR (iron transport regulator)
MTVDDAWTRLEHTLHGTVPEAQRQRASISRHEAAEHMAALGKKRNWVPVIVGGIAAVLAVVAAFWYFDKQGEPRRIESALSNPDVRKYDTGPGQLVNVTLDDQTVVRLAPQTRLTVPKLFGPKMRAVKVDGAAHFNVVQAMEREFLVYAGDVVLVARGTAFTVRAYAEDSAVVVDVREGTVELRRGEEIRTVAQGTSLRAKFRGAIEAPSVAQLQEASGWVRDTVTIQERTLRYILPQLKRFYGLDVKVPDAKLLDRPVFLHAALTSPREAIASVEKSAGVVFSYVGETMTFQDSAIFKGRRR